MSDTQARRFDLDWLRIGAFALLILYHVGMFYVTWDWHVKSGRAGPAIEPLMLLTNPWRLLLLFFISGVATRFLYDKMTPAAFTGMRMWRLVPPLLFAMFVIVPPQSYYEVVDAMRLGQVSADPAWLDNFYLKYVTASGNWCDAEGCLITPTWNHMWFVAYLIVYTLLIVALGPLIKRAPKSLAVLASGPAILILPWAYLALTRIFLSPIFEQTHALVDDWYLHAVDFAGFVLGFALAKHQPFFASCERMRFVALVIAVAGYAALMTGYSVFSSDDAEPSPWLQALLRVCREGQAWGAIVALVGFAHRYLRDADGPVRRYLTQAIFPFYIIHQTAIVVFAYNLDKLDWPLWLEAPVLIILTTLACWSGFELIRRVPFLRPLFGLAANSAPKREKLIEMRA